MADYRTDPSVPTPKGKQATPERIAWLLGRPAVSPQEAMEIFGKSRNTIDAWVDCEVLESFRSGPRNGRVNITTSSIKEFLENPKSRDAALDRVRERYRDQWNKKAERGTKNGTADTRPPSTGE